MAYTLAQLVQFAEGAGFTGDSAKTIAAISMAESGGNANAINLNDPNGGSFGLTQINGIHPNAAATLGNPQAAFAQAYQVSGGGTNFTPWSTYTSGAYAPFANQLGLTPLPGIAVAASGTGQTNPTLTPATFPGSSMLSSAGNWISNLFIRAAVILVGVIIIWQGLAMLRNSSGTTKIVENINVKGGPTRAAKHVASKIKEAAA